MSTVNQNPHWLNDDLLQKILQSDPETAGKSAKIETITCEAAVNKGDNYSSEMFRLYIQYSVEDKINNKSYIVKCMHPPESDVGKMLKKNGVFEREVQMYSESLIKMDDAIKSINDTLNVAPKLICWTNEPYELMVIEDLRSDGFRMPDRVKGLDKKHCDMIFVKLAKMHAASMHLNRRNPQFRKYYNVGAFNDNMADSLKKYFINGILQGTDVLKRIPSCQKYVKFYEKYATEINDDGMMICKPVPEDCFGYNVLTHGDFWLNNIMFKYNNEGEPIDVKFVDFQQSTFGCVGLDINYFFFTSPTEETRAKYRDDILSNYLTVLNNTLAKFRYDALVPTKADLDEELMRSRGISIMTVCIVLPIVKLDKKTSSNITTDDIMDDIGSESRTNIYGNIAYEKALEVAVNYLAEIGFVKEI